MGRLLMVRRRCTFLNGDGHRRSGFGSTMRLLLTTILISLGLFSACSSRTEDIPPPVEPTESESTLEQEHVASATIPLIDERPIQRRQLFVPLIDAQSSRTASIPLIDSIEDARIRTAIRPIDEGLWEVRRSSGILPIDAMLAPAAEFAAIGPIDGAMASLDATTTIAPIDHHRWDAWARIRPIDLTVRPELGDVAIRPIDYHLAAPISASIEPIDYFMWSMAGDPRVLPIEYYLLPRSNASIAPIDQVAERPARSIQPIDIYIPSRTRREADDRPAIQPFAEPEPPTGLEPF